MRAATPGRAPKFDARYNLTGGRPLVAQLSLLSLSLPRCYNRPHNGLLNSQAFLWVNPRASELADANDKWQINGCARAPILHAADSFYCGRSPIRDPEIRIINGPGKRDETRRGFCGD